MFRRRKQDDQPRTVPHEVSPSRTVQVIEPGTSHRELRSAPERAVAEPPESSLPQKEYSVLESVDGEGLVLIGRNTHVVGEITNCIKVEIQGGLDGTLVADAIVVREGGVVRGRVRTTNAEVHGDVDGEVVVDSLLDIRTNGQVTGDVSYGRLSVAVGGHISGQLKSQPPAMEAASAVSATEPPPSAAQTPRPRPTFNGRSH